IADEHYAPGVPAVGLHPLDHVEAELLVALEGGEVLRDRSTQVGEAPPDPLEATRERVLEWLRRVESSEAVRTSAAHRNQAEEAAVAHHDQHVVQPTRAGRDDAAPDYLAGIAWWRPPDREGAHRRMDAIGADDQVVVGPRAVAEVDADPIRVLRQPRQTDPEPGGHGSGTRQQRLVELAALDADTGADVAPQRFEVGATQDLAVGVAECPAAQDCPGLRNRAVEAEDAEHPHAVG